MKRKIIYAVVTAAGLFLLAAPMTFLKPCSDAENLCVQTAKAAELTGILIAVLGVGGFFLKEKSSVIASAAAIITAGITEALIPSVIGCCGMASMTCRLKTVPGIYTAAVIVIIAGAALIITGFIPDRSSKNVL